MGANDEGAVESPEPQVGSPEVSGRPLVGEEEGLPTSLISPGNVPSTGTSPTSVPTPHTCMILLLPCHLPCLKSDYSSGVSSRHTEVPQLPTSGPKSQKVCNPPWVHMWC